MISPDQLELADYIKNVHLSLRRLSRQIGAEEAWRRHLANEEVLKTYSVCMKKLAEDYWHKNNRLEEKNLCRIKWMADFALNYFENNGLDQHLDKELKKMATFQDTKGNPYNSIKPERPYKLLDVGSCYDPFWEFKCFETFPIDLYPAKPQVKKCNFIDVNVQQFDPGSHWFDTNITCMPAEFFDVVVFSLFLEYLPSCAQRYICCQKAHEVLKKNGLLLIATPDSKHESANASIMKSWKVAFGRIGFVRIKLEKLKYIYCSAFRKSVSKAYPSYIYKPKEFDETPTEELIKIPQDVVDYSEVECAEKIETKIDENSLKEDFEKLPYGFVDSDEEL